ncbi:hypothetical protein V6N11_022901 [Hibiscus sabdariffa]|uniref:Uncharacterized protein n=1 Tax=Hibiscus sabdariffa TaxID=183260 RepID=A0ABR2TKK2_9ROSI
MDDINLFTYERNARPQFFVCRSCHIPVLPGNDISAVSLSPPGDAVLVLCLNPCFAFSFSAIRALVEPEPEPERQLSDLSYGNDGSGHTLQFFASTEVPDPIMSRRMWSVLRLNQLLYWNGTQMVYADTHWSVNSNRQ